MGRRWALAVLGALVALGATAAAASGAALVPLGDAQFASDPIYATGPPGDGRLFVVERAGRIDVVDGGALQDVPHRPRRCHRRRARAALDGLPGRLRHERAVLRLQGLERGQWRAAGRRVPALGRRPRPGRPELGPRRPAPGPPPGQRPQRRPNPLRPRRRPLHRLRRRRRDARERAGHRRAAGQGPAHRPAPAAQRRPVRHPAHQPVRGEPTLRARSRHRALPGDLRLRAAQPVPRLLRPRHRRLHRRRRGAEHVGGGRPRPPHRPGHARERLARRQPRLGDLRGRLRAGLDHAAVPARPRPDRAVLRLPAQRRPGPDRLRDHRRLRGPRPDADRPRGPLPVRRPLPHRPAHPRPRARRPGPAPGRPRDVHRLADLVRRGRARLRLRAGRPHRVPRRRLGVGPVRVPEPRHARVRGDRRRRVAAAARAEAGRDRRAARRAAAATGRAEEAAAEAAVVGRAQAAAEAAAAAAARAPSTPPRRACAPPAPWPAGAAPCASPSPATRPAT